MSYAHSDRQFADRLFALLRQAEIPVIADQVNLPFGVELVSVMRSTIATADFLILLLSPEALESKWVQRELEYAVDKELRQRSVTVVPLKVKPCTTPDYLATWTVIDATRNFDKAIGKLADLLRAAPRVQLGRLGPPQFESLVGDLLRAYGFKHVRPSVRTMDSGFDFTAESIQQDPFGRREVVDWLVQVKATRRQADMSTLRAFLGALSLRRERGLFITSGQVTTPAREWLDQVARTGGPRISLMEGNEVTRLLAAKPRLVERYFGRSEEA